MERDREKAREEENRRNKRLRMKEAKEQKKKEREKQKEKEEKERKKATNGAKRRGRPKKEKKKEEVTDEIKLKPYPNSTLKIPFIPDINLKQTLDRWFGCARKAYNITVKYLNQLKEKKVGIKVIRKKCISDVDYEPTVKQEDKVPYDVKDIELNKAYLAFNGKRRKKSNDLQFRSKKHMFRESFTIPNKFFTGDNSSSRLVERIIKVLMFHTIKSFDGDVFDYPWIVSKNKLGKYHVCVPIYRKPNVNVVDNQDQVKVVSIDPGSRTPFACYDPSGKSFKISEGKVEILYKHLLRRDRLNSNIQYMSDLKGKASEYTTPVERKVYLKLCKTVNRMKKRGFKLQERIDNLRKEFHYQAIKYLLSNYDVVIIPDFKVKEMTSTKKDRVLSKSNVRRLGLWCHYTFRQRLINKAELLGKQVIVTDERYTTKVCGNCGQYNKITTEKEFTCTSCKTFLDRDINASRNILVRFLARLHRTAR